MLLCQEEMLDCKRPDNLSPVLHRLISKITFQYLNLATLKNQYLPNFEPNGFRSKSQSTRVAE